MTEQERLDILVSDFRKLEESQKGNIQDLIQKLTYIHCGREYPLEYCAKDGMWRGAIGMNPA